MLMVAEKQSGSLNSAPLQVLQFPTMAVAENIVKKKLKIKIASKGVQAAGEKEHCENGTKGFVSDKCNHSIPSYENEKSGMDITVKIPSLGGYNKRTPEAITDTQKEKRRKMDRSVKQQCGSILKALMTHRVGWVFNHPVDPVALKIPDYFDIISNPMDLGTIKSKLEGNLYFNCEEFAADVRLTFSNAMLYNPPSNQVHHMAKDLDNIFNRRWKLLEAKWKHESQNVEQEFVLNGPKKNTHDTRQTSHKKPALSVNISTKSSISLEEKQELKKDLAEILRGKMTENLRRLFQKFGFGVAQGQKYDVNIDAYGDETLFELKRAVKGFLNSRSTKGEPARSTNPGGCTLPGKNVHKGTVSGTRSSCGSVNVKPLMTLVASKCDSYESTMTQCQPRSTETHSSSADLSSGRLLEKDGPHASKTSVEVKKPLASHTSRADPDSDGSGSSLDEENIDLSPGQSTTATTAASVEGWSQLIDVQLSPKKALRAAMLRSRFADTIFKAKQKKLLDHGDVDPVKMQQEREKLEKQQCEERAWIAAKIKAAEDASRMKAEAELKMQREREREAARLALEKMEKTVEIDDNLEILKDLETLSQCPLAGNFLGYGNGSEGAFGAMKGVNLTNPLQQLGLYIKEDYVDDEDDDTILNGVREDGEIFL